MAKTKRSRRRLVPEVLWRLFHNKARTLADTILSLLPSPPSSAADCQCKGRWCLGCIGDKAMSYLLRPKDPSDYRKLLTQCFVVVPEKATPFSGFDPHNGWPQLETVRRIIEMIMCEQPTSSNVLCSGYNKLLRLLDKHCGVSSLYQDSNNSADSDSEFEGNEYERNIHTEEYLGGLLAHDFSLEKLNSMDSKSCMNIPKAHAYQFQPGKGYCLKTQVVSFIWAVCRSIVPRDMLGTPPNWRILRKNISKFVCLRRFEQFTLKQCIHKLKISKFSLLSNKHSCRCLNDDELKCGKRHGASKPKEHSILEATNFVKHKILESWIIWFFSWLVVPLLQAHFYVTESEHGKQEVFYYRKSVWKKLMGQALSKLKDQSCCMHL